MVAVHLTMTWEPVALGKYQKMLGIIPTFHRAIAQQVVNIKAEELATARGSVKVEEEDIVRAFFSEVPKAFYSLMVRVMDEVGFNYKIYK